MEKKRMEWNGKTDIHLWNKNNVHRYLSIFSLICLIIFYETERNGTEKPIEIFRKIYVHRCFSIFCLSFLIIFYGTEWNGTETLIYIFGIKTMFVGVSQSLA
jgi:hypothetical protein